VTTTTVTCTTNDADEGTLTFTINGTAVATAVPALGTLGKVLTIALVLGLGLLGFSLSRRTV
jgi:hypothetical protein